MDDAARQTGEPVATPEPTPLLTMRGITRQFPNVLANDRVDLDVYGAEVHTLLGENGAGKSTLMKILYGFYQADAGEIAIQGRPVQIHSPHDARLQRIGMVFQDLNLIPAFTVAENIAIFLPDLKAVIDMQGIVRRIQEVAKRYDLEVDVNAPVWQLSIGQKQKVEILKLILADARILILDEPTKVLAPHEVKGLFRIFDRLRADGYAVLFITHKLDEVMTCADRITVMRRGKVAGTLLRSQATEDRLVGLMFEKQLAEPARRRRHSTEQNLVPLVELCQVETTGEGTAPSLRGIDLKIFPGEIVGVAGVSGNGQKELGDVLLGVEKIVKGEKRVMGEVANRWPVARVRRSGISFVPEDPMWMSVVPYMSIAENMALGDTRRYARRGGFSMDWNAVRSDLKASLDRMKIAFASFQMPVKNLSGGNVQRFILARELSRQPRLVIAFYPTRGMDVPSVRSAWDIFIQLRDAGASVLLISEDLGELFALSDRMIVVYQGRIVGTFKPEDTSMTEVGHLMTGSKG